MTTPSPVQRNGGSSKFAWLKLLFLVVLGYLLGLLHLTSDPSFASSISSSLVETKSSAIPEKSIIYGTLQYVYLGEPTRIPYSHCTALEGPNQEHIVLLHGKKFTKTDWRTSGILKTLCSHSRISVSAVDLPARAGHSDLKAMLTSLSEMFNSTTLLPVTLVTPSASGFSIVDWITTGRRSDLPNYVDRWIPIAPSHITHATSNDLRTLKGLSNFKVLAMYGEEE